MNKLETLHNTIPLGKHNGLPISDLAEMWKVTGRDARRLIEEMIYNDLYVCNLRSGYFRPETREELQAYANIIHSYKCKHEKKYYRLKKGVETWNQTRLAL